MAIRSLLIMAGCLWSVPQASAQQARAQPVQPDPQVLGQAYDRCMATYAVRLSKTAAGDDAIYTQARQSCASIEQQFTAALRAQLPAEKVTEVLRALEAQTKPNFMSMLTRIRSDRARRAGEADTTAMVPSAGYDTANPAQCESALQMLAIIADTVSPAQAPELRRRLALAKQRTALQLSAKEASAARNTVWPFLKDKDVLTKFARACPR